MTLQWVGAKDAHNLENGLISEMYIIPFVDMWIVWHSPISIDLVYFNFPDIRGACIFEIRIGDVLLFFIQSVLDLFCCRYGT